MTPLHSFLAVLVAVIWGINFTFIGWGLESFPPLMLTALRFFFTAFPLVLFIKPPKITKAFLAYALGTFTLQFGFVFIAMKLGASAGLSALILQFQVFSTLIMAYFLLKETLNIWQIIGLLIALMGISVIGFNLGGDMPLWSFICLIFGAVSWSSGNIALRSLNKESAFTLLIWGGLISSVVLFSSSLVFENKAWNVLTFKHAALKSWLSLGFIVYISTFIGYGLWTYLLQKNPVSKVIPFTFVIPIAGIFASVILTGEVLTWWKIMAMILIIFGLLVSRKTIQR